MEEESPLHPSQLEERGQDYRSSGGFGGKRTRDEWSDNEDTLLPHGAPPIPVLLPYPPQHCGVPAASRGGLQVAASIEEVAQGESERVILTRPSIEAAPLSAIEDIESDVEHSDAHFTAWQRRLASKDPVTVLLTNNSGFCNDENDCYACSVLTLLLRNHRFMAGLLGALPSACKLVWRQLCEGEEVIGTGVYDGALAAASSIPVHAALFRLLVERQWYDTDFQKISAAVHSGAGEKVKAAVCAALSLTARPGGMERTTLREIISQRAFYELQRGVSLAPLIEVLDEEQFFSGSQEDAHEFFIHLLTKLEAEGIEKAKQAGEGRKTKQKRSVWVNDLMQGKMLTVVRCRHPHCCHEVVTADAFVDLSLPLLPLSDGASQSRTIQELIQSSLAFEALEDYVCDRCQSSTRQVRGAAFQSPPPPLLVVQLKRFEVFFDAASGEVRTSKCEVPVDVDETIALLSLPRGEPDGTSTPLYDESRKRFSADFDEAEKSHQLLDLVETSYQLQAVLQHHGGDLLSGHYTCAFRRGSKDWLLANDHRVTRMRSSERNRLLHHSTECYLLLYDKVEESPVRRPVSHFLSPAPEPSHL